MKDQNKVSEILADHFAIIANGIGRTDAGLWDLDDFSNHPSLQLIEQQSTGCDKFDFQEVNPTQVKRVLESRDANKATGHDGISAKILKAGAEEISLSLCSIYNSYIKRVSGHASAKKGTGHQSIKRGRERQGELQTCNCAVICKQSVRAFTEKPSSNKV